MTLLAYHGDSETKVALLNRLEQHRKADEIVQRLGWTGRKGCAVGCTLHSYDHRLYPALLGIPQQIAHIEDVLFEAMTIKRSRSFPIDFVQAVQVGADLSLVPIKWLKGLFNSPAYGLVNITPHPKIKLLADILAITSNGKTVSAATLERAASNEYTTDPYLNLIASTTEKAILSYQGGASHLTFPRAASEAMGYIRVYRSEVIADEQFPRSSTSWWRVKRYTDLNFIEAVIDDLLKLLASAPIPQDSKELGRIK